MLRFECLAAYLQCHHHLMRLTQGLKGVDVHGLSPHHHRHYIGRTNTAAHLGTIFLQLIGHIDRQILSAMIVDDAISATFE